MNESIDPSLSHTPKKGGIHNRFGTDLLESVLKTPGKNALLSPASIEILLAMIHAGARSKSRNAIETALITGSAPNLQKSTAAFLAHLRSFRDTDDLEILSANGMWGQTGYVFNPDYVRIVRDTYDGEISECDFGNDTEGAINTINAWVKVKTRGMIPSILEVLDPITRLVLGNAIYFKAHWAVPFDKALTREKPFYLAGGGEVPVKTMHKTDEFLYRKSEDFEMVGLPYKGGMVTFVIFLPTPGLVLEDMRPRFKAEYMEKAIAQASMSEISLAMPRLSLRWGEELKESLIGMGLGVLFGTDANLKGITAESDVSIGEIIHKAAMDLDEEGTEAAAISIATMIAGSAMDVPQPIIVQVDRPFLFAIRDNTSGANLFLGQVHNPTAD